MPPKRAKADDTEVDQPFNETPMTFKTDNKAGFQKDMFWLYKTERSKR
jgi:hypothetical protein